MIKFGAPVFFENNSTQIDESLFDPYVYADLHKKKGYTSAYCPKISINNEVLIKETREVFKKENIMLAEVGFWQNLMDTDPKTRKENREKMVEALYLAESLGAKCAVDVFGSYCHGKSATQCCKKNFSEDAFCEAVDMARYFIDTVKPKNTSFAYEIFAFNIVNSVDNLERLIKAVDREKFGVHYDLTNLIVDAKSYFYNAEIANDVVNRLGDKIVSVHVKDIKLTQPAGTIILNEVVAGEGNIDFKTFFKGVNDLPQTVPMMMEHLSSEAEYDKSAEFIRNEIKEIGIEI